MNHSKIGRFVLAVSLALNLGVGVALILRPVAPPIATPTVPPAPALNLPEYLQLNATQRSQWAALEPGFLGELQGNWQDIRRHREALVRAIFATTPDPATIAAEHAAIAQLQAAQQQRVIAQLQAERALLDAGQRARLLELLLQRYSQDATEEEQLHRH
ncbi:MAG: periplasmic heavy metal sensor [Burkholderiales bacterium]|nr:periplasmic heavy metal sensor [Burkholderiales bacterium]MBK9346680.1 periplasmic heavy metal sensor [Burkholderiales bacterium]